jgi:hypothetical protein
MNLLIIEMHQVLEGQKDQIEAKAEFDIAQFRKQYYRIRRVKQLLHLLKLV